MVSRVWNDISFFGVNYSFKKVVFQPIFCDHKQNKVDYFTFYVIFDSFICEIAIFTLETLESSRLQLFHIYIYIYIYI